MNANTISNACRLLVLSSLVVMIITITMVSSTSTTATPTINVHSQDRVHRSNLTASSAKPKSHNYYHHLGNMVHRNKIAGMGRKRRHHLSNNRQHSYYRSTLFPSPTSSGGRKSETEVAPPTSITTISVNNTSLSPFHKLHQAVRQKQSSSRQRHNYYYHYNIKDNTNNERNPVLLDQASTYARWHGARHLHQFQQPMPIKIIYQQEWVSQTCSMFFSLPIQLECLQIKWAQVCVSVPNFENIKRRQKW